MRVLHFIMLAVIFLLTVLSGGAIVWGFEEKDSMIIMFGSVAFFGCFGWFILILHIIFG